MCWQVFGDKGNFVHCWLQPLWKTVLRFLKKLKIELPYDAAVLLLSIYLKKTKRLIKKIYICIPPVHCSIIYSSQEWKWLVSFDR